MVVLPESCPALKADQLESKSCCCRVWTVSGQKQSFPFQDFTPLHFVPAGNTSQPVFVSLIKRIWHWRYMLSVRYQMKVAKEWMKATKCCSATLCIIWERQASCKQKSKQAYLRLLGQQQLTQWTEMGCDSLLQSRAHSKANNCPPNIESNIFHCVTLIKAVRQFLFQNTSDYGNAGTKVQMVYDG